MVAVRTSTNGWFGLVWFGGDHQHWKKGLMGKILGIWSEAECGGECKTWILLWVGGNRWPSDGEEHRLPVEVPLDERLDCDYLYIDLLENINIIQHDETLLSK